ncbi:MAG: adenylate/guanylate cyclase domain-containing protein [Hyphomicrobiaceae bacterium]
MNHTRETMSKPLDLSGLLDRIVKNGLEGLPLEDQLADFSEWIVASGFPMKRASMGVRTLHPQYGALTYLWRPGMDRAEYTPQERAVMARETYLQSPIHHLVTSGQGTYRHRLDIAKELPFAILKEIRDEGMTDYAACLVRYDSMDDGSIDDGENALQGVFFSCATDALNGFNPTQLQQLTDFLPHLAVAIKSRLTFEVAKTVAQTYLGQDAGKRVLTGEIIRGSIRSIDAVIWFCDLRGFTDLSDSLDGDQLILVLNLYLEILARPVEKRGGQILKFLGDGFLATFDLTGHPPTQICNQALEGALELREDFHKINKLRTDAKLPTLGFGLALHIGTVLYGNIGTDNRLDFTVVGPAVNEASRIQDFCRPLDREILLSQAFKRNIDESAYKLTSLGVHELRGVSSSLELFSLAQI